MNTSYQCHFLSQAESLKLILENEIAQISAARNIEQVTPETERAFCHIALNLALLQSDLSHAMIQPFSTMMTVGPNINSIQSLLIQAKHVVTNRITRSKI